MADAASPALAALTKGRVPTRPRSSGRSERPSAASRVAALRLSGSPSPRAKSLAVPTGITASGRPAAPAAAAAGAMLPSPPATTTRSAPEAAARSASSGPNSSTATPNPRSSSARASGSVPAPELGLTISAIDATAGGTRRTYTAGGGVSSARRAAATSMGPGSRSLISGRPLAVGSPR